MMFLGYYSESNVKVGIIFVICVGVVGEIGYSDVDFWVVDDVYYLIILENINSKYVYYFLWI